MKNFVETDKMRLRIFTVILGALLLVTDNCGVLNAQDAEEPSVTETTPLTDDVIAARRKAAAESTELTDELKAKLEPIYQQAQAELDRAAKLAGNAATFAKRTADAPATLDKLKAEATTGNSASRFKVPPDADPETIESKLADARAALEEAQTQFNNAEGEPRRRAVRQAELPGEIAAATAQIEQAEADLAKPLDATTATPLALAERTLREAQLQAARQQAEALRSEEEMLVATSGLPALQLDVAAAKLAPLKKDVEKLAEAAQRSRAEDIEDQLIETQRETEQAPALVKPVLQKNMLFLQQEQQLAERRGTLEAQLAQDTALRDHWRKTFDSIQANIEAVGLWETIAWEMRSQRRLLPDPREYRSRPASRREEVRELQYERLKLYDLDAQLASVDDEVDALLASSHIPVSGDLAMEIRFAAHEAYQQQARIVDQLQASYERYFELVTKLDTVQREIAAESTEYANFVDERVLWIRSMGPMFAMTSKRLNESLGRWTSATKWQEVLRVLGNDLRQHYITYLFGLAAFVFIFYFHRRCLGRIDHLGNLVRTNPTVPLKHSLEAVFLTLLVSLLWPGLLFVLAWRIGGASGATPLVRAVADGVFAAACTLLFLNVPRRFCRGDGIADAHLGWPSPAVALLRRVLRLSILVMVPAAWFIGTAESLSGKTRDDVIGRGMFVLSMLFAAVMAWRLFRPRGAIVQALVIRDPASWLARMRHLLFVPGVALALILGGLAAAGFYHTALELARRVTLSVELVFLLIVAYGLGLRWTVAARVRLARARMVRERQSDEDEAEAVSEIDSATIKTQTQRLLLTVIYLVAALALWWIWIEVVPALGALRRVAIANTSLGGIVMAVIMCVIAYMAARNLPGMLEVSVLQHLPLDGGSRYAITTICRYVICLVAVVIIAWLVGFDWSNIQWLVAAMLVGLGFGLQEIFANFVSGLIILLERPIRPGDWVTIGTTDGRVSRINMRATTIVNWDSKELIVPNKDIVTGQVMNWSLSENMLRFLIDVGIAYGSDTQLATDILQRICDEHPHILEQPKPAVIFRQFGDSTLNFQLRIFIPHLDVWPDLLHEIHMNIDREFRAAGVEIAFPQRDLHIRSSDVEFATGTHVATSSDEDDAD